ncbi:MAG: hypothetical protein ACRD3Y_03145 [Bryobacteraceae bacterium]
MDFDPAEEQTSLVTIRVFTSESEADVAKAALEAFGIKCITGPSDAVGDVPSLRMAQGIPLLVRSEDADEAEQVLKPEYRPSRSLY